MTFSEIDGTGRERDLRLILQVFDCVVPDGEGSYLASPISTGRRYYEALSEYSVTTFDALLRAMGEEKYLRQVRWPNVEDGQLAAEHLRRQGAPYLINTGPIFIREWPGAYYMDLCFQLIEKKIRVVYLHPEWAYSSGAVQEYFFCRERNLPVLDIEGQNFTLTRAADDLDAVLRKLKELRLPTDRVEKQMDKLREVNCAAATR